MLPDPTKHNPDPHYLRGLLRRVGWSQRVLAEQFGLSVRIIEAYLSPKDEREIPYHLQWTLECLVLIREAQDSARRSVTGGN